MRMPGALQVLRVAQATRGRHQAGQPAGLVGAEHHADAHAADPQAPGDFPDGPPGADGVQPAGVGDQAGPASRGRQRHLRDRCDVPGEAGAAVLLPLPEHRGEGELSQRLAAEVVDAVVDDLTHPTRVVLDESLAGSDPKGHANQAETAGSP